MLILSIDKVGKKKAASENVAYETRMHQHSLAVPATKTKNKGAQTTPHTQGVWCLKTPSLHCIFEKKISTCFL